MSRTINLANMFPEPTNVGVSRGPLPRQLDFLNAALAVGPGSPKYVRYLGGIGSGKTMIGCITMLTLAVMYEGDYLIGRQFYPELRDTTLKTFLELCPPELIIEYRVADAIVVLRNAKGTKSSILFRALEDPDKLRSLNLNAFYIDESCQATEAAFLLLQGRLRGKHVRKGFLTTNSDGRSWGWRYFVQKGMFKDEESKKLFLDIRAPSTENVHLPEGYVDTMLKTWSQERIDREINADEDSFEGAVYSEFRRDVHVIKPFRIPDGWKRVVGADHGFRNPAAFIWGAIDYDGNIYLYKEYYEKEKLIEEICKDVEKLNGDDQIEGIWIDPSIKATRGQTGLSDWHTYCEHLPKKFALFSANNDVASGIDRFKSYLKISEKTKRPSLYVFDTLTNFLDEIGEYRWDPMSEVRSNSNNFKEQPRKYKDHILDAARYLVMSRPDAPTVDKMAAFKNSWETPTTRIAQEMHRIKNPQPKDPFQDF